jgi:hypothetical protein
MIIQLKPEKVPDFLKGKFFELHVEPKHHEPSEYDVLYGIQPDTYVGWVHIREDGRIEFGEPGV